MLEPWPKGRVHMFVYAVLCAHGYLVCLNKRGGLNGQIMSLLGLEGSIKSFQGLHWLGFCYAKHPLLWLISWCTRAFGSIISGD